MKSSGTIYFTFVVPVYNVESYIRECVNSIRRQTFVEFEIILIDDGSTDKSGLICDELSFEDARVRVVHKKNGGLSSARNAGIDIAYGKYIIFLDGDDFWIDDNALNNMRGLLEEQDADTLIFPMKKYYEKNNVFVDMIKEEFDKDRIEDDDLFEAVRYMIKHNIYKATACNKVIRKSLLDKLCLRFKVGYTSEDVDWCGSILMFSNKFACYTKAVYAYRQQREGSITKKITKKSIDDRLDLCEIGLNKILSIKDINKRFLYGSYYAYEYAVLLGISGVANRLSVNRMRSISILLDYDISNKVRIVGIMRKILGFGLTRKALCLFVQIKNNQPFF